MKGSDLLDAMYKERKRIIEKKKKRKEQNQFSDKI